MGLGAVGDSDESSGPAECLPTDAVRETKGKFVPFWESNGLIEISRRLAAERRSGQHAAVPTSGEGDAGTSSTTTSSPSTSGTRMEEDGPVDKGERCRPDGPDGPDGPTVTSGLLEFGLIKTAVELEGSSSSRGKTAVELEETAVRERVDVTAMTDAVLRLLSRS